LNGSVAQFKRKHRQRISQIHAVARRPPKLRGDYIKTVIRNIVKKNKKEYRDDTESWISSTTICRWHREVSELHVRNAFQQANQSSYFTFGIMADESDNTNYMRGYNGGAVAKFNQLAKSNCTRIPCGLHVLHLILNNFEETAFSKLSTSTGFSKT
ncbi:20853_t:CDS:2, partial [Gigaspora rosea]